MARTAIGFHLYDSMPKVLPAALGAVETTVLREAGAYASLEEGGREVVPSLIDSVQDRDGTYDRGGRPAWFWDRAIRRSRRPSPIRARQLADPQSTFQVFKMMEGVVLYGTGKPVGAGFDRPIAGKTGTTQDFNDGWFAGFTPDLVTIVWVGYDTPRSLGEKQDGAHVAGPIWHDFMRAALQRPTGAGFPRAGRASRWRAGDAAATNAWTPSSRIRCRAPAA